MVIKECVDLILTLSCQNRCTFCLQPHMKRQIVMPPGRVDRLLRKARALGAKIVLTGGEPTLYPDFFEVVAKCRGLAFERIGVVTNARRCAELGFARRVLESGIQQIGISVHSHVPAAHDAMTGVPGSLKETCRGVANLLALKNAQGRGVSIWVGIVLGAENAGHVPETIRRLSRMGVRSFIVSEVLAKDGREMARYPVVRRMYRELASRPEFRRLDICLAGFPACLFEPVTPKGDGDWTLRSSNGAQITMEPVRDDSPDNTLNPGYEIDGAYFEVRSLFTQEPPPCRACSWKELCFGVPKVYAERFEAEGVGWLA